MGYPDDHVATTHDQLLIATAMWTDACSVDFLLMSSILILIKHSIRCPILDFLLN